jgi:hypothetical protein
VITNSLVDTSLTVYEWGNNNRMNPDFTYKDDVGLTEIRGFIWKSHRLVTEKVISSTYKSSKRYCIVVLEPTISNNPVNIYMKYNIGVYLSGLTKSLKRIELTAPLDFQDIKNCRIKKGLVLKDSNNINDEISCQITKLATKWFFVLNNFGVF